MPDFESRAVRALVLLHDVHLRRCVAAWHEAKADEALLAHILEAPREELLWICRQLELPEPALSPESSLDQILAVWQTALLSVTNEALYEPEYTSAWGSTYSIVSMLEHVVMHAIRHEFQLAELLAQKA